MKNITTEIGVVILNWNAGLDTVRCIKSVKNLCNLNIVVVDNGSNDDSLLIIKREFNDIKIIEMPANLGYAAGNNAGLRETFSMGYKYGLVLNNDCILVSTKGLENVLKFNHEKVAIYGLAVFDSRDRRRHSFKSVSCDFFGVITRIKNQYKSIVSSYQTEGFYNVDRVSGAAMLISKNFFETVSPIDERYFLYCEEIDYCFKARLNGWLVFYEVEDSISIIHSRKGLYQRPYVWYYTFRNMILFCRYNFSSIHLFLPLILCFSSQIKSIIRALFLGNFQVIKMMLLGFTDGIYGKTGIMKHRLEKSD